ncbi:MAG: hypothetical protein N2235_09070 [Fischerella sp.]|nr:hypothetical protein [Fischerella sp.]
MKPLFKNLRAIATVNVGEGGRFAYKLGNIKTGESLSAIANITRMLRFREITSICKLIYHINRAHH